MTKDLEQLADEAAIKYRENPGMRPQELFMLGFNSRDAEIKELKARIEELRGLLGPAILLAAGQLTW